MISCVLIELCCYGKYQRARDKSPSLLLIFFFFFLIHGTNFYFAEINAAMITENYS